MYAKHGNLVDAGKSGPNASTKHLESRLEVIRGHADDGLRITVSEILQIFELMTPPLFNPNFGGVSVESDRPRWGQPPHKP